MNEKDNSVILLNKLNNLSQGKMNFVTKLKLLNIFSKVSEDNKCKYVKAFLDNYYCINEDMPEDFYRLVINKINKKDGLSLMNILAIKNIYSLISYLKHNNEIIEGIEDISPLMYYSTPKRHINRVIESLKNLQIRNSSDLNCLLEKDLIWNLKREPICDENEYTFIAYKMYLSIGLDNCLELLSFKYGELDYEKVYFLFSKLEVKNNMDNNLNSVLNGFLFNNKKDSDNTFRQMLNGEFKELFLNFDYFYNKFNYFISRLGERMSKEKVKLLLDERYISKDVGNPSITGDILDDMISSYYCKYGALDTSSNEIYTKNFDLYNEFLKDKFKSSIPMIKFKSNEQFSCEIVRLDDPRSLVIGYRSGNCFRINGDASILFHQFLKSEHMRLLSISTNDNKDFAMTLIMRNGNVLIAQGIETSKWVTEDIKGKKLYDTVRESLKEIMDYMNSNGDEIVATVIGRTNSNVSEYNNQILPFLINPILENTNNYYNGIDNYQCLLDI